MATKIDKSRKRPMNIVVRRGSHAEDKYRALGGVLNLEPEQIAPGIAPTPMHNLLYHGGKTIPNLIFTNFYVGGDAWHHSDIQNIDTALAAAMTDPELNNVMAQYFNGVAPSTTPKPSQKLPGAAPATFSQGDVEKLVGDLYTQGKLSGFDYGSTVFNFMLPPGTVLNDNPAVGGAHGEHGHEVRRRGIPEEEQIDSLRGLGGYHGSIQSGSQTIYYAVGVYSDSSGGQSNGIPVFDAPWKNVVATFYHVLNEARTDPDVEAVINGAPSSHLGWTSRQGEECGDFPVFEANPLTQVFQEVALPNGGTLPVQFQYSNYVHGPEGPVSKPDPAAKAKHSRSRDPFSPPSDRPGEAKKEAFATMRVFFGTDRKPTGDRKPDKFFAAERGPLSFGAVEVSIPHDHRMGELEGPSWWKLEFRKNPKKHVLLISLKAFGRPEFIGNLRKRLQNSPSKEALLFIHGYNVSFEDACRRTAQIAYDLNFQGAPITYSWPSEGKATRYLVDETNVHWSVPHFRDFLSLVLSETGAEAVHVVAHSMGNRTLVEALRTFDLSRLPVSCARLTQVIFAAPDIDAGTFQEVAEEFRQKATRFTLYASSKDVALQWSKTFHKYSRAGDSGGDLVLLEGLDTIDATKVDTGLMGHSYIGDNDSILADLYDLLRGSPPPKRFRLKRKERTGREYWMFQP